MTKNGDYDHYVAWKKWEPSESTSIFVTQAYEAEFSNISIKSDAKILEIGFGDGRFLSWAKKKGYFCIGTEVIDELVSSSLSKGYEVYLGSISDLPNEYLGKFDLICMWDVMEHMEKQALPLFFKKASDLLKKGGKIIIRVPNGSSPFSRHIQYGDFTHNTVISDRIIEQLANPHGMILYNTSNSYRSITTGNKSGFKKYIGYICRDFIEIIIGYLYFGKRVPLDPVITVILKKTNIQATSE